MVVEKTIHFCLLACIRSALWQKKQLIQICVIHCSTCAFSVVLKCVELNYSVIIVLCAIFVSLLFYNQAKLVLFNEIQDKKACSTISDRLCLSAWKYYSISVNKISAKCHIGATLVNCNGYIPTLIYWILGMSSLVTYTYGRRLIIYDASSLPRGHNSLANH